MENKRKSELIQEIESLKRQVQDFEGIEVAHKQMEETLRESEERMKLALEGTDQGLWDWDVVTGDITFGDNWPHVLGYTPGEMNFDFVWWERSIHPDSGPVFEAALNDYLKGQEKYYELEYQIKNKSGEWRWIWARGICVTYGEQGEPLRMIGTHRDITERKRMEEKIKKSEHLRNMLLDNLPLIALILKKHTREIVACNKLAMDSGAVVGKTCYETLTHCDHTCPFCLAPKLWETNEFQITEVEYIGQYWEGRWIPFTDDLYIHYLYDITRRKQAEENLRDAEANLKNTFDISPGLICVADANTGYFTESNPAVTGILGISVEEFTSRPFMEFVHPDDRQRTVDEITKQHRGTSVANFENRYRCKDGSYKWLAWQATAADKNGKVYSVATDITHRKQAEDKLSDSLAQLRNLAAHLHTVREEERATIARNIHDDMGQILTTLKINLSLIEAEIQINKKPIKKTDLLEELKDMQDMIDNAIINIKKLVKELRPEVLDNLSLLEVLKWQADEFENRNKVKCLYTSNVTNIDFNNEKSTAIFRILQEVLTNVSRHSKATTVKISFNKKKGNLILKINDNGIGFSEKKVFDPNSFGLLGMRERAIVFGGRFEIITQKGIGTTVTLSIPIS